MRRSVQVLMLVLLLGQVGGFYVMAGGDPCLNPCEDDAQGQDCPPACPTCSCSLRSNSILAAPAVVESGLPPMVVEAFTQPERHLDDPGPREILHVPIAHAVSLIG
jgi:hypothetical protein